MYLLRCSQGHEIPVNPKSAGGTVACPACGESRAIPKLGELRQLPRIGDTAEGSGKSTAHLGYRISFAALMLVALASAAIGTFAAFRWQTVPVPMTTEHHIAHEKEGIATLNPLQLIELWDRYAQHDLSQRQPFPYQIMAQTRAHWKRICLGALGVTALSLLCATGIAIAGRGRKSMPDT